MGDEFYDGFGGQKLGLTYNQIVLMHINRCVINGSVEWHGGFWETKITSGGTEKTYIPNTRAVYTNSIKQLRALLLGYFDSEMNNSDKEIQSRYISLKGKSKLDSPNNQEIQDERISLSIELFESLVKLAKRLNFFQEESLVEDVG